MVHCRHADEFRIYVPPGLVENGSMCGGRGAAEERLGAMQSRIFSLDKCTLRMAVRVLVGHRWSTHLTVPCCGVLYCVMGTGGVMSHPSESTYS